MKEFTGQWEVAIRRGIFYQDFLWELYGIAIAFAIHSLDPSF